MEFLNVLPSKGICGNLFSLYKLTESLLLKSLDVVAMDWTCPGFVLAHLQLQ